MHVDSKSNNLGDTAGKCKPGGSLGNFKKSGRLPAKPGGSATTYMSTPIDLVIGTLATRALSYILQFHEYNLHGY